MLPYLRKCSISKIPPILRELLKIVRERVVEPKEVDNFEYMGKKFIGMRAFCDQRQDERMFRVDRILEIGEVYN